MFDCHAQTQGAVKSKNLMNINKHFVQVITKGNDYDQETNKKLNDATTSIGSKASFIRGLFIQY